MTLSRAPLPHQLVARDFLANGFRVGLFDDMGSGKTASTIFAMDQAKLRRGVIVCPAAVRQVWLGELKKFEALPRRRARIATSLDDLNLWLLGRVDLLIISYEFATRQAGHALKYLQRNGDLYDVLVLDEFHYLKSPDAQRTLRILGADCDGRGGWSRYAAQTWCLTGTPMANDPTDCWTFLRFSGATGLTTTQFRNRYFDASPTAFGARYSPKPETADTIRDMLAKVSLRRTKSEFWKDMPEFWLTDVRIDGDTDEIRRLIAQHPDLEEAIREAARTEGLSALHAPHIATLRRLVGTAKAPPFASMLDERLKNGLEKAVVMAVSVDAINLLFDEFTARGHNPVKLYGETSPAQRKLAVETFQNDRKCRVFLGNVRAAGTGLTLTAASEIFMLEQSWSPADNAQALMRVHRIGQTRNVTGTFVALANSIDEDVVDILAEKTAAIARIDPTAFAMTA